MFFYVFFFTLYTRFNSNIYDHTQMKTETYDFFEYPENKFKENIITHMEKHLDDVCLNDGKKYKEILQNRLFNLGSNQANLKKNILKTDTVNENINIDREKNKNDLHLNNLKNKLDVWIKSLEKKKNRNDLKIGLFITENDEEKDQISNKNRYEFTEKNKNNKSSDGPFLEFETEKFDINRGSIFSKDNSRKVQKQKFVELEDQNKQKQLNKNISFILNEWFNPLFSKSLDVQVNNEYYTKNIITSFLILLLIFSLISVIQKFVKNFFLGRLLFRKFRYFISKESRFLFDHADENFYINDNVYFRFFITLLIFIFFSKIIYSILVLRKSRNINKFLPLTKEQRILAGLTSESDVL